MRMSRMLNKLSRGFRPEISSGRRYLLEILRFPGSPKGFRLVGYGVIAAAAITPVFVWTSLSQFQVDTVSPQQPYHAPLLVVLGLIIIEIALFIWVRMLAFGNERVRRRRENRTLPETMAVAGRPVAVKAGPASGAVSPSVNRKGDGETAQYRVLVADDDLITRMKVCRQLIHLGVPSESVCDGREALAAVKAQPWDLILMDGHMPGLDGVEAARAIRDESLMPPDVPVIIMTSDASREFRERCTQVPVSGFYQKPLNLQVLKQLVSAYLGSPRH